MAKKNSTYDKIRAQSAEDTARYRDVHAQQQVGRSYIEGKSTMKGRLILVSVVCGIAFLAMWYLVGAIEKTGLLDNMNKGWYSTFYSKDGAKSEYQYVTVKTDTPKVDGYGLPVYDDDGEQMIDTKLTRYIVNRTTGFLIDITNGKVPVYTECNPAYYDEAGNLVYSDGYETVYDENGYPVYSAIGGMSGLGNADGAEPTIYLRLLPVLGAEDDAYIGKDTEHGYVYDSSAVVAYFNPDGKVNSGDEQILRGDITDPVFLSRYGFEPGSNNRLWLRLNRGKLVDTTGQMNHEKFMDLRPTPLKLILPISVSGILFLVLYLVMKKNLDIENAENNTEDINQHHDDSRLQMPEEIQSNYDIFPDVGAHSSVMVSSMIGHQALTNKGLKKIKMAKRAKKDILDEDGDVVTYKGDMIRDDNGDPVTVEVPMIDNEFTEGLFDSSKTLPQYRKYYNATDIPYNPGNENLDKLKGYDKVSDLINNDWEFPLYEPQRPGGIYVVDTAPVNTMVLAITRAGKGQTIIE